MLELTLSELYMIQSLIKDYYLPMPDSLKVKIQREIDLIERMYNVK